MIRDKSRITSLGLDDAEGTVRGRMLGDIVTDDAQLWPKKGRFGIFAPGWEWPIIAFTTGSPSSTITVALDQRDFVEVGDTLNVTRVIVSEAFASRPFVVASIAYAFNGATDQYETTFTLTGTLGTLAIDGGDFVNLAPLAGETFPIRPAAWQSFPILSQTTGVNGSLVIAKPSDNLPSDGPWEPTEMFQADDVVLITGSANAINDGEWTCRAAFANNTPAGFATVPLAGYLNATGGVLGTVTMLLPAPLRVVAIGRVVLRAYRYWLLARSVVRARLIDQQHGLYEILIPADIGASDAPAPDDP